MTKINRLILIALASASALLGGCGGAKRGSMTTATAVNAMGSLATILGQIPKGSTAASLPSSLTSGGVSLASVKPQAASVYDACTTITSPVVDADADGIPKYKGYTFNCSGITDGTSKVTHKGTLEIVDYDDALKGEKGGFKYNFNVTDWTTVAASGDRTSLAYKGYWEEKNTASSITYKSAFTTVEYVTSGGKPTNNLTMTDSFNVTITPTDMANPWDSGAQKFTGTFTFSGTFQAENVAGHMIDVSGDFTVEFRSQGLIYDKSCTKFYRSGKTIIEDGGGNMVQFIYSCSTAKAYLNGTELKISI